MAKKQDLQPRSDDKPAAARASEGELDAAQLDHATGGVIAFGGVDGESTHKDHKGEIE